MPTIAPPAASPADAHDTLRRARVYLARVAEPPATSLAAFIEAHGPIEAAGRVRAGDVPDAVREETGARRDQDLVDEDLAAAAQVGARLILPEDGNFRIQSPCCPRSSRGAVEADAGRVEVVLDWCGNVARSGSKRCVV